jgi:hypothetical protein
MDGIQSIEPGFITVNRASGPPIKLPLADFIRVADVPAGLTHQQVDGVRLLANLNVVLIRTLIEKDILDESFADSLGMNWDLDHIIYALEQLGGSYHEPDFDGVEVA